MLGFGWVIIHFWRCIIRKYTSFIRFLVRFLEKEKKIENLGKSSGSAKVPLIAAKVPLATAKVLVAAWHIHAAARSRGGFGEPWVRRDEQCSQHKIFGVLFRFVFPLVRGLVYRTNEDPMSL